MKITKRQLIARLMAEADDTADRYSTGCWSVLNEETEQMADTHSTRRDLQRAVTKFVTWLLRPRHTQEKEGR